MTPESTEYRHLPLSFKLTATVIGMMILALLSVAGTIYYTESNRLETDAENRIEQAVQGMQQMISQSITHTIRSQLQATADRNREILEMLYARYQKGKITEEEAKEEARRILLSQTIGKSGYLYIVDSTGTLHVHPKPSLVNANISQYGFIQDQIRRKNGYLEYDWKNPGEKKPRPKALAMSYFKPWDYIISASAYREEFSSLVNLSDFRDDLLELRFGKSGYAYVIDTKGTLLIHPELEGTNIYDAQDADGRRFIAEMCKKKNGRISYPWKNPGEDAARYKDVVFRHFPELDIILAGGIYQEDLYEPLRELRGELLLIFFVVLLISVPLASFSARALGRPVLHLSDLAQRIADRDLRVIDDFERMRREQTERRTWFGRGAAEIISLLGAFQKAGFSIRELVGMLGAKAEKLSQQQSLIESAAAFSSDTVSDQTVMVGRVSDAVSGLQQTFTKTERMAEELYSVADQAVRQVNEGRTAVGEAEEAMTVIQNLSEAVRTQILQLGDVTAQIEEMVRMVQGIAVHSQILSVNAGIQAAKAGVAGRGFSVVAAEVRELAAQSAESTNQIKELLRHIQNSSESAVRATHDSCAAVDRGRESVERIATVIGALNRVIELNSRTADHISKILVQQSDAIRQISQAVTKVEQNSVTGSKTVEGLLQAVEELRTTQDELSNLVVQYRV